MKDSKMFGLFGLCFYSQREAKKLEQKFGDFHPYTYEAKGKAKAYKHIIELLGLEEEYKKFEQTACREEGG